MQLSIKTPSWPVLALMVIILIVINNIAINNINNYHSDNVSLPDPPGDVTRTVLQGVLGNIPQQRIKQAKETILVVMGILFLFHSMLNNSSRLRTTVFTGILAWGMRIVLFSSTILPDASSTCNHTNKHGWDLLIPSTGDCHDLLASGHSILVFLMIFASSRGVSYFHNIGRHFLPFLLAVLGVIEIILILFLKHHYTIDILTAFLVVFLSTHLVSS